MEATFSHLAKTYTTTAREPYTSGIFTKTLIRPLTPDSINDIDIVSWGTQAHFFSIKAGGHWHWCFNHPASEASGEVVNSTERKKSAYPFKWCLC